MNTFYRKVGLGTLIFPGVILLICCENSNRSEYHAEKRINSDSKESSDDDSKQIDSEQHIDTVTCLDISFVERLESGLESEYKDGRLEKMGYKQITSNSTENGQEITFENRMKNRLIISKSHYPDGEISFKVEYFVDSSQLMCMENQLNQNNYSIDKDYHYLRDDRYLKKGLGTYEKKRIVINANRLSLTYIHILGKEINAPPIINTETE